MPLLQPAVPFPLSVQSVSKALLAITCFFSAAIHATCLNSLETEMPTADFTVHGAVVTHNTTGLMWMRCALGQKWLEEKGACGQDDASERLYSWPEALIIAHSTPVAGYADWRLPNKNELASIVERACTGPAINEDIYPDTPLAYFWTSTPSLSVEGFAWRINFTTGTMVPSEQTNRHHVRLVREL